MMAAMVSRQGSTLNPNAPLFIPAAYRQVEDFSPEWWELVKTSTWFRDYWISQYPDEIFDDGAAATAAVVDDDGAIDCFEDDEFRDLDAQFQELLDLDEWIEAGEPAPAQAPAPPEIQSKPVNDVKAWMKSVEVDVKAVKALRMSFKVVVDGKALIKSLSTPRSAKERFPKSPVGSPKYCRKAAQCVSPKCAARRIQQPR